MIQTVDIPTAVSETEAFRLREYAEGGVALEVGSLLGYSTVHLARAAAVVHSVDPHEGYPRDRPRPTLAPFLRNLERHGVRDRVVVHVGRAQDVLPTLDQVFDFAFIDVDGGYEATAYCLWKVGGLVKAGGWMAVHDFGRTSPDCSGATRAAQAYLDSRGPGHHQAFLCETTLFLGMRA